MLDPSHPFSLRKHLLDSIMTANKNIQMNVQLNILTVNALLSKHLQSYWYCIEDQSHLFIQIIEKYMKNTRKYILTTQILSLSSNRHVVY